KKGIKGAALGKIIASKRPEDEINGLALKLAELRQKYDDFQVSDNLILEVLKNPKRMKEAFKEMVKQKAKLPGLDQALNNEEKVYLSLRFWLRNFEFATVQELVKVFGDRNSRRSLQNSMSQRVKEDKELMSQFAEAIKSKSVEDWQAEENITAGSLLLSLDSAVRKKTQEILLRASYKLALRYEDKDCEYDAALDLLYQASRNFNLYNYFMKGNQQVGSYYTYTCALLQRRLVRLRGYLVRLSDEERQVLPEILRAKRQLLKDNVDASDQQIIEQLKDKHPLQLLQRLLGLCRTFSLDQGKEEGEDGMYAWIEGKTEQKSSEPLSQTLSAFGLGGLELPVIVGLVAVGAVAVLWKLLRKLGKSQNPRPGPIDVSLLRPIVILAGVLAYSFFSPGAMEGILSFHLLICLIVAISVALVCYVGHIFNRDRNLEGQKSQVKKDGITPEEKEKVFWDIVKILAVLFLIWVVFGPVNTAAGGTLALPAATTTTVAPAAVPSTLPTLTQMLLTILAIAVGVYCLLRPNLNRFKTLLNRNLLWPIAFLLVGAGVLAAYFFLPPEATTQAMAQLFGTGGSAAGVKSLLPAGGMALAMAGVTGSAGAGERSEREFKQPSRNLVNKDGPKAGFGAPWRIDVANVPTLAFTQVAAAEPEDSMFALNIYLRYLSVAAKKEIMNRIRRARKFIEKLESMYPDALTFVLFGSYPYGFMNEIPRDIDVHITESKNENITQLTNLADLFDRYSRTPETVKGVVFTEKDFLGSLSQNNAGLILPYVLEALTGITVKGKFYYDVNNPPSLRYIFYLLDFTQETIDESMEILDLPYSSESLQEYRHYKAHQVHRDKIRFAQDTIDAFERREKGRAAMHMRAIRLVCQSQLVMKLICDLYGVDSTEVLPPTSNNPYINEQAIKTLSTYITEGAPHMSFIMDGVHNTDDFTLVYDACRQLCEALTSLDERVEKLRQRTQDKDPDAASGSDGTALSIFGLCGLGMGGVPLLAVGAVVVLCFSRMFRSGLNRWGWGIAAALLLIPALFGQSTELFAVAGGFKPLLGGAGGMALAMVAMMGGMTDVGDGSHKDKNRSDPFSPQPSSEKAKKVKEIFGENAIKDELDLNYDFQQLVEGHRRERFEEGNEGGAKGETKWFPLRIALMPLFRCVANCLYCFFGNSVHKKDEMSIENMAHIFDTQELLIKNIFSHLSGGEIFLRDDVLEMIEKFPIVSLVTNAATMTSLEKAKDSIIALKKVYEKRIESGQMEILKPDSFGQVDRYQRSWLCYLWMREKLIELTRNEPFHIGISLDDICLAEHSISVGKIANLIVACVNHYPKLGLGFIAIDGKWKEEAYPALKKELERHGLALKFNEKNNNFLLTRHGGFRKLINLKENSIEKVGGAFANLSGENFGKAILPKQRSYFGFYKDYYGLAIIDYSGNMSISDGFLAEHAPLIFGNVLEEGWSKILKRVDKDPLFRALVTSTQKIISIAKEYDPDIVKNIQEGKPGGTIALFYWLLSNPERKLYVTYRLLQDYYEEGVLKGKNPFKDLEPHEIKALVEKEVGELRDEFRERPGKATDDGGSHESPETLSAFWFGGLGLIGAEHWVVLAVGLGIMFGGTLLRLARETVSDWLENRSPFGLRPGLINVRLVGCL
ncbi:hypothetical protein ACFL2I_07890, partial [Candidatus Omnitrophota bacterium]